MYKNSNTIPFFYKYLSIDTALLIFKNRSLRWSTFENLNDPFDMNFNFSFDLDFKKIEKLTLEKLWHRFSSEEEIPAENLVGQLINMMRGSIEMTQERLNTEFGPAILQGHERMRATFPSVMEQSREIMKDTKILCLTTSPASTPMWSHYASNHSGVVLRFHNRLDLDSAFQMAQPINYRNDIPKLFDEEFWSDLGSGAKNLDANAIVSLFVYSKSVEWSYEKEWRICSGSGRNAAAAYEDMKFHQNELGGVIFGHRIASADRERLIEIIQKNFPHAEFMQAKPSSSNYGMMIWPFF